MTDAQFTAFVSTMKGVIEKHTPYDTGNLAKHATRSESLGSDKARIYVDLKIAPYFEYVNNRFRKSNGKRNVNYQYFEDGITAAVLEAARINGGKVYYE